MGRYPVYKEGLKMDTAAFPGIYWEGKIKAALLMVEGGGVKWGNEGRILAVRQNGGGKKNCEKRRGGTDTVWVLGLHSYLIPS